MQSSRRKIKDFFAKNSWNRTNNNEIECIIRFDEKLAYLLKKVDLVSWTVVSLLDICIKLLNVFCQKYLQWGKFLDVKSLWTFLSSLFLLLSHVGFSKVFRVSTSLSSIQNSRFLHQLFRVCTKKFYLAKVGPRTQINKQSLFGWVKILI